MRQSNAGISRNRMNLDSAGRAPLNADNVSAAADLYGPIAAVRRDRLDRLVAQIRSRRREPRVCLYALSVDGHAPRTSFELARAYAESQSWQVAPGQSYADRAGATSPECRPGWGLVRDRIRAGFTDGVVVVTADAIGLHVDEYRRELDWFAEHCAFVALVMPETVGRLA
ncbi:hypothetical protein [Streptomyces sp. NPDC055992]|uniref:hypothetical protein n=1 Tax=Streptomyces sp. NPDC055992 TaxID=3345673 RepID=UPI0035D6F047